MIADNYPATTVYLVIPSKLRFVALVANLLTCPKSLVFVNTMAEVNFLHETLSNMEMPQKSKRNFYRLHGDMEQPQRVENLKSFRADSEGDFRWKVFKISTKF